MQVIAVNVISAAQSAQYITGIPASVQIAQFGAESGWGARCTGTFNYFGVKAVGDQPSTLCATHEVIDGKSVPAQAAFANYSSLDEAFTEHAKLLADEPQYAPARACLPDVAAFVEKMAPVYATDPTYAGLLLEIISEHRLTQYDMESA